MPFNPDTVANSRGDAPFPLISFSKSGDVTAQNASGARIMASEMTLVHNLLIRGINAIYVQSVNVSQKGSVQDNLDFAGFASCWAKMIQEHHESEESKIFPDINRLAGVPGLMDANVIEHSQFHDGLADFQGYIDQVRAKFVKLDGYKLREIIDNFMPALHAHLENEISTLVQLEEYADKQDWGIFFRETVQEIVAKGMESPTYRIEVFPLMFCLHDKTFDGGIRSDFPPVSWLFQQFLRWMYLSSNKNWWRFAPCDLASMPRDMPFA